MQLIKNIKTLTVQILHHIQKRKCVPCGHRDAGFARTDEILANGAEAHRLPIGFHIHVSTWPRDQPTTEARRASHPALRSQEMPGGAERLQGPANIFHLATRSGQICYPLLITGTSLGFKTSRWMETQWLQLWWLKAAGTDPRVWR